MADTQIQPNITQGAGGQALNTSGFNPSIQGSALPKAPDSVNGPTGVATSELANNTINTQKAGFDQLQKGVQVQAQNKAVPNPNVSVVDLLGSKGQPSDFASRTKLASEAGIQNYTGTADQNKQLIGYVNNKSATPPATPGQTTTVIKPGEAPTTTTTTPTTPPVTPATTPTTPQDPEITKLHDAIDKNTADLDSVMKGTFPLTASQQQQITDTKAMFDSVRQLQMTANANFQKMTENAQFRFGTNLTDPLSFANNNQAAINEGISKISEIDRNATKSMNDLQQAFMDKDYKMINDQYTKLQDQLKQKTDAINRVQDLATAAAKDARDFSEKVREFSATQQLEYAKIKATQNPVSNLPNGNPNHLSQQEYLKNLTPGQQTVVKGLTDYSINPDDYPTSLRKGQTGITRSDAVALAKAYDPNYDDAQYKSRAAYLKNIQTGTLSQAVTAANKSVAHLTAFANSVTSLKNGGMSSKLNAAGNFIEQPFSKNLQTNLAQASTEANGVKDELAKFFKGSGSTDVKSIDDWGKSTNVNATPGQLKGTVQGAVTLLAGQLDTLNQQYTQNMGHPPVNPLLQPETMAKLSDLKNQGYKIDIPGVDYTDKTAWIQNGGGTQDSWNTAVDNLTALGLPLTDENILQAAQSQ